MPAPEDDLGYLQIRRPPPPPPLGGSVSLGAATPARTDSQACGIASLLPPAGPQAQGWTGKCRAATVSVGLRWGFTLSPSARAGQARYPEGGRRREDEPLGEGWRVRANAGDDEHQGDEDRENSPAHPGAAAPHPACMAPVAPLFRPYRPTRTRQDPPCIAAHSKTQRGSVHARFETARTVPAAPTVYWWTSGNS